LTSRAALLDISRSSSAFKLSRDVQSETRFLEVGTLRADDVGGFSFTTQSGVKTLEGSAGENAMTLLQRDPPAVGFAVPSASVVLAGFNPSAEEYDAWMDLLDSERVSSSRDDDKRPEDSNAALDHVTLSLMLLS